jgi:excisionase family DNA binding protein
LVGRRSHIRTNHTLVSLAEAARLLGVNYDALIHHVRVGHIPHHRMGRVIVVEPSVVKAILDGIGYRPRQRRRNTDS